MTIIKSSEVRELMFTEANRKKVTKFNKLVKEQLATCCQPFELKLSFDEFGENYADVRFFVEIGRFRFLGNQTTRTWTVSLPFSLNDEGTCFIIER